jgi:hypothetical protein
MHIEVKDGTPKNPREYKGAMWGEVQAALVAAGLDYPLPFRVNRAANDPVTPGRYHLDATGFGTDDFGNLKLNRVRLGPAIK